MPGHRGEEIVISRPGEAVARLSPSERHRRGAGRAGWPFTVAHAAGPEGLPLHHRDPFDRMLFAEGVVLVTVAERVRQDDVPVFPPRGART